MCAGCPFIDKCAERVRPDDQWMFQAGMTPRERAALRQKGRRDRRKAASPKSRGYKDTCPKGHDTTDPAARYVSGSCKACTNDKKKAS